MKYIALTGIFMLRAFIAFSQNPIVPPGIYLADPAAHQWGDGKMYVYGSRDESTKYYCSWDYDILSSENLKDWIIHRNTFASRGKTDEVPYSDEVLYAPDCMYKNGIYYLYYCQPNRGLDEGVATSYSPTGPFKGGSAIKGVTEIDPAVFIDEDNQAYFCWGQFSLKMAKLNPNMKEIDSSTIKEGVITEAKHFFHEGIQLIKINGIYYLVYTDISRRGMATCIGYSTSDSPFGPYTYRGVIIDNYGCDPNTWNNHGSIAKFNDRWFVFYHRSTCGSLTMRKACIEPITFNSNGTISEAEMTTQGAAEPLSPFEEIDAAKACYLSGKIRIAPTSPANEELVRIENRNSAAYKYFNFTRPPKKITVKVTSKKGGIIQVYTGNLSRPRIALIEIPEGDGIRAKEFSSEINEEISGIHPVYFRFTGTEDFDLFNLDWFIFE
jgi:hypothetical protein